MRADERTAPAERNQNIYLPPADRKHVAPVPCSGNRLLLLISSAAVPPVFSNSQRIFLKYASFSHSGHARQVSYVSVNLSSRKVHGWMRQNKFSHCASAAGPGTSGMQGPAMESLRQLPVPSDSYNRSLVTHAQHDKVLPDMAGSPYFACSLHPCNSHLYTARCNHVLHTVVSAQTICDNIGKISVIYMCGTSIS